MPTAFKGGNSCSGRGAGKGAAELNIERKDMHGMKPVYIINGFLESGKTEFITYTIAQPYFRIQGKTLIIACEEGEVEYGDELLRRCNAVLEVIEEEEDCNPNHLVELEKSTSRNASSSSTTACGILKISSYPGTGRWNSRSLPLTDPPFPCIIPTCALCWRRW